MSISFPFFASLLRLAGVGLTLTLAPGAAMGQRPPQPATPRATDSARVEALRREPDQLLSQKPLPTRTNGRQRSQMLSAGQELERWATTYVKPYATTQTNKERYFRNLVLAGRYYTWANRYDLALRVYERADQLYPDRGGQLGEADKLVANYQSEIAYGVQRIRKSGYQPQSDYAFSARITEAGFDPAKYATYSKKLAAASSPAERDKIRAQAIAQTKADQRQAARQDSLERSQGIMHLPELLRPTDPVHDKL